MNVSDFVNTPNEVSKLMIGYIYGLGMTHGTDTDHDITVATGAAKDDSNTRNIILASAITKQADATWVAGTNAGGMATGESLPTSGTIHVWLIVDSATETVDVMFNNNATTGLSPALPTGYDYKRRIGSYRTDSSANILNGDWWGTGIIRMFMYDTPVLDVNITNPGTSANTYTLSVPQGVIVKAMFNAVIGGDNSLSAGPVYVSWLSSADLQASETASPLGNTEQSQAVDEYKKTLTIVTNASGQIRYRQTQSNAGYFVRIATLGWEDSL